MTQSQTISRSDLQMWLLDRVAFYLDKPVENIDPALDLARYGMDSVYAISLISEIEDRLQIELNVPEARRQWTIDALTDYVLGLVR